MALKFRNKANNILTLGDGSGLIAPLIFGCIFFALGAVFLFFGNMPPVLDCHKIDSRAECLLSRHGLFPFKMRHIPINNFSGAEIKTHEDSDGDTYSIILKDASGAQVPFVNYSSSGYKSKVKVVREITQKLNTQNDFKVIYRQNVLLYIGLGVTFFALLMFFSAIQYGFSGRVLLEADLQRGILKIYPYNCSKKYEDIKPLADLADIKVKYSAAIWKDYAVYVKQLCAVRGLREPFVVKIYEKLSSVDTARAEGVPQEQENARSGTLVIKFKDSSFAYAQIVTQGNAEKAVNEFRKYLGLNG